MDLDGGQLGGGISWAAPAELTLVTHYVVPRFRLLFRPAAGTQNLPLAPSVLILF